MGKKNYRAKYEALKILHKEKMKGFKKAVEEENNTLRVKLNKEYCRNTIKFCPHCGVKIDLEGV